MYTPNQVSDAFQSQLGRAPTDYEIKTYQNAAPQVLAGLKTSYSKLNSATSITDYLKSVGIDPNTRDELAQKYGIANIGTAEGNTALLTALKAGQKPPSAPAVTGSIATPPKTDQPAPTTPPTPPAAPPITGINYGVTESSDQSGFTENSNGQMVPGSISAAAESTLATGTSDSSGPSSDPIQAAQDAVDSAYANQQQAQKAVRDIDATLARVKQDKIDEIARSGGVVNESALMSEIVRENEPLMNYRKQLVDEYTAANGAYQKALADRNSVSANYYKSQQVDISKQKLSDQESQFAQKLQQSGWKSQKVNVYDEYGNVTGQQIVWTQNPGDANGIDQNGNPVTITQGSEGAGITPSSGNQPSLTSLNNFGGIKFTPAMAALGATDSGIKANDGGTFAAFPDQATFLKAQKSILTSDDYANLTLDAAMNKWSNNGYGAEVAPGIDPNTKMKDLSADQLNQVMLDIQSRETGGSTVPESDGATQPFYSGSTVNAGTPGYSTATVIFKGKDTQLTQAYIDKIAIAAIMNGGVIPNGATRGTKGLPILQSDAIKARIGQLDPTGNLVANKAEAQAWGKALGKQIDYATNLNRSLQSADADFQNILSTYDGTGINENVPLANIINDAAKYHLGSADIAAFQSSLLELSRLYSQVFAGNGGTQTDQTRATAANIMNATMSMAQLKAVQSQLQTLGKIDVQKANEAVTNASNSLAAIGGQGGGSISFTPRGSTDAKTFVEQTFENLYPGETEASLNSKYASQLTAGEQLAFDNETGDVVAVNPKKDDMSKYTPI